MSGPQGVATPVKRPCPDPVRAAAMRDAGKEPWRCAWRAALLAVVLFGATMQYAAADTVAAGIGHAEARFAAAIGGDWPALEELLADDFIYNTAEGTTLGKRALIAYLRSAAVQVGRVDLEQTRVREYGDVVVSSGVSRVDARIDARQRTIASRFLHVWAREGEQWKLVARQVTYVKTEPGAGGP